MGHAHMVAQAQPRRAGGGGAATIHFANGAIIPMATHRGGRVHWRHRLSCGAARPLHYSHGAITSLLSDTTWDRSQAFKHVPAAECAKRHCNYVMTLHTSAAAEVGGKGHVS